MRLNLTKIPTNVGAREESIGPCQHFGKILGGRWRQKKNIFFRKPKLLGPIYRPRCVPKTLG